MRANSWNSQFVATNTIPHRCHEMPPVAHHHAFLPRLNQVHHELAITPLRHHGYFNFLSWFLFFANEHFTQWLHHIVHFTHWLRRWSHWVICTHRTIRHLSGWLLSDHRSNGRRSQQFWQAAAARMLPWPPRPALHHPLFHLVLHSHPSLPLSTCS